MHCQLLSREQLLSAMKDTDPFIYSFLLKEPVIIGFNSASASYYKISVAFGLLYLFISGSLVMFCTVGSSWSLMKSRHRMHSRTAHLFIKLLVVLIIDMLLGMVIGVIPICVFVGAQALEKEWASILLTVILIIPELYPLSMNLLMVLYIQPYREYIIDLAYRATCGLVKEPTKRPAYLSTISNSAYF
jgi:cytochrome bd-type quinol oxidase subunit 2